jgi:hypothetical protein
MTFDLLKFDPMTIPDFRIFICSYKIASRMNEDFLVVVEKKFFEKADMIFFKFKYNLTKFSYLFITTQELGFSLPSHPNLNYP